LTPRNRVKCGHILFSHVDVYWIQTQKQIIPNRQAKYIYRLKEMKTIELFSIPQKKYKKITREFSCRVDFNFKTSSY